MPYLRDEQIERDAAALLAEYEKARGVVITRQVPIEDIVERYLKLRIEFDDTHRLFNVPRPGLGFDPDILGAMFFDERRIVIDESLRPSRTWGCGGWAPATLGQDHAAAERWAHLSFHRSA